MENNYEQFFKIATGQDFAPYPYQIKLATQPWPDIVNIPTGLGKTAGIIVAWLFKRLHDDPDTPRRLVYCLPMRVLVEQTAQNTRSWIKNIASSNIRADRKLPDVRILMGGEIDRDWDRFPEQEAILIGTQDQLLSRALNRGYATSRFRWPIQFGLLNNNCLWVMDEIQLMGSGLATTTQLQAFRKALGTTFPVRSIWMSATLQPQWLGTVDFADSLNSLQERTLKDEDRTLDSVKTLLEAEKTLSKTPCPPDKPQKIAETILQQHQKNSLTLAIFNTVKRAKDIYTAIKKLKPTAKLILLHSRFRLPDRAAALEKILAPLEKNGTICIATQVVEAGMDISARTLITDLAPWASMVQRFGRCNRYGENTDAQILWIDLNLQKKGAALPYTEEALSHAKDVLSDLKTAALSQLPSVSLPLEHRFVIRRKDLIDLFDTTPDLSGLDIDISKFIRETEDHDLQVFWRDIDPKQRHPDADQSAPTREELCSVPVADIRQKTDLEKWVWDHLEKQWVKPPSIHPGMRIMLRRSDGGYSVELGWTGNKADIPTLYDTDEEPEEGDTDDFYAALYWQTLPDHTREVIKQLEEILSRLGISNAPFSQDLILAARWHDAGKAHPVFQNAVLNGNPPKDSAPFAVWAKTVKGPLRYERKGFRHELASALVMLQNGLPDLCAYLAASHHGKVRLSIRSLPHESPPENRGLRFARGIYEGDTIEKTDLGDGHEIPKTILDLSYMELGQGDRGPSWLERMLSLRDDPNIGPLRLAYLEALLRAADWRGSENSGGQSG